MTKGEQREKIAGSKFGPILEGRSVSPRLAILRSTLLYSLLIAMTIPAHSQDVAIRSGSVSVPPEFSGEPKKVSQPAEAEQQLFEVIGHLKEQEREKVGLPALNKFIEEHPDYSDAYFLRATLGCELKSPDFEPMASDVRAAMSHSGAKVPKKADYYSLLGKIAMHEARYKEAMDDLEIAMSSDLTTSTRIFNIQGVQPETNSAPCVWNLTDLNALVQRFPTDFRTSLFKGLYYEYFTTFKEEYFERALPEFQRAALLNPRSPVPPYLIGKLHTKESFWTKKAWASDTSRDQLTKSSIPSYTRAIQLDSKFLLAYAGRAEAYHSLKQNSHAIPDYDKVLTLDPENFAAYSDRGLAKLETGQYLPATFDFEDAIRRKDDSDIYLPTLYEYLGDAELMLGTYRDAISAYSKAIEMKFSEQIILLSLKQIRGLYPEFDLVSDDVLCHKLYDLFSSNMDYAAFAKQLTEENGKWSISELNEMYEKRGDTYLKAGDFRRGVLDFQRIFKGIPNFADSTDRWRALGKSGNNEDYFLDVKSAAFSSDQPARLWIKIAGKKESKTLAFEINCKAMLIDQTATITYDPNGKVLASSDLSNGWQQIIPDSIGEQLFNGACTTGL